MPRAAALSMKCPEEPMSKSMEKSLRFRWSQRPHSVVIAVPVVVLTWSMSDVISILFDLSHGLPGFVFRPRMELQIPTSGAPVARFSIILLSADAHPILELIGGMKDNDLTLF